ncbi:hypothetical protein GGI15_001592 [Coemansia interrupta]|uniref:Cell wall protein n=1 Tax=Coemansia interrupta TaxID=1126814 RepID=A0A9W8LME3_9FUNG|nr:hypothetical protein GGI15_001592 [Coemansia interrupta]
MRTGYALALAATLAGLVSAATDTDYDQFISSLSYNWQNEFSDLRYQVAQLQQDDPAQYSQLAAALGLKAGATISVPSQYDPVWASKFVQAAGLYTPPAPTFDPAQATPTAAAQQQNSDNLSDNLFASALQEKPSEQEDGSDDGGGASDEGEDSVSHKSSKSSKSSKGSKTATQHRTSSADDESDAGESLDDEEDVTTSQQFGNPIVGSLNTNDGPIIPSGQGYSAAAPLLAGLLTLALPLLTSSLF